MASLEPEETHLPDHEEWPQLTDSVAGINNQEGLAQRRLDRLMTSGLLRDFQDDDLGRQYQAQLCSECAALNLTVAHFLPHPFPEPGTGRDERDLLFARPYTAIRMSTSCPLCGLIQRAVDATCNAEQLNIQKDSLHCLLYMTRFSCFWDHEQGYESFRFLTVLGTTPSHERQLFAVDILPVESKLLPHCFVGRIVPEKISPQMIKRWLQQCEFVHKQSCMRLESPGQGIVENWSSPLWNEDRFMPLLPSLYFIDVHFNCLTRLPAGGRYLALSYVWGNVQSMQAHRSTIKHLKTPGSLWLAQSQLPAVILDAMQLTADIGERYLWVDSLCIVQDDLETKQAAINKMNLVYGNAFVTIIAATGDDASTGLLGLGDRPRSQQQDCAIIGPHLKLIVPHSLKALEQTKWANRAWTFQEYFFSPRRLIFVNGQVVFKCSWDAPSREDILSEYQIFGMEDYTYKLPHANLGDASMAKASRQLMKTFLPGLIQSYSRRQLSFQGDILNAFAGVTDMLSNECGFELCNGLIKSSLTCSMLWSHEKPVLKRRVGFPSWSWCGWVGETSGRTGDLTNRDVDKWTTRYSWIHWYLFDQEKQFRLIAQQKWQCQDTEQDAEDGDEELAFLRSAAKQFMPPGMTPPDIKLVDRPEPIQSSKDGSGLNPQYLILLQKNEVPEPDIPERSDSDPRPAPFRNPKSISNCQEADLNLHTIYFRTLGEIVWISPYDPEGHTLAPALMHVHLYDDSDRYLGVAWLDHLDYFYRPFVKQTESGEFKVSKDVKLPVHIAVLSGASPSWFGSERWMGILPSQSSDGSQAPPRFYQVMILTKIVPPAYDNIQGAYERAGIGEIAADVLEGMDELVWEDFILQ